MASLSERIALREVQAALDKLPEGRVVRAPEPRKPLWVQLKDEGLLRAKDMTGGRAA